MYPPSSCIAAFLLCSNAWHGCGQAVQRKCVRDQAAAIAAKIAAQFASGGGPVLGSATKDPHDGDFTHDIDINDVRNRYLLTKGSTQQQVCLSFET